VALAFAPGIERAAAPGKRFSAAIAPRPNTRRRTKSHTTNSSVVKQCVTRWKIEPGTNAQFYTVTRRYLTGNCDHPGAIAFTLPC
jgi:hypothetical protein